MQRLKQLIFTITRAIAAILPQDRAVRERRRELARRNMQDHIQVTAQALLDMHISNGECTDENIDKIVILSVMEAAKVFLEKKVKGDYDELNCLLQ